MFNNTFLKACKKQPTDHIPIWLMRQAGRYQKEYQKIKEKYSIIDISTTPELSAKVTLIPINQFELDAAIIFSDILIPLKAMGIPFNYKKGYGPYTLNPIKTTKDVENLKVVDSQTHYSYTGKSLEILKKELSVPCIGFVGAPFTLASYMIEGGPSKNYIKIKKFMYNNENAWDLLMEKLAKQMSDYLKFQIKSGAQAVQMFDSWCGILSHYEYKTYVYPYTRQIVSNVKAAYPEIPFILFGVNTAHQLDIFLKCQPDVIGIDWKTDLKTTWNTLSPHVALQGNLDPTILFAEDWTIIKQQTDKILESMKGNQGFIFNLGHGILPNTPVDNVAKLCHYVRNFK